MNPSWLSCSLWLAAALAGAHAQPVITKQPTNQSVSLGASAKFQVSATSTNSPIRYQWRFASADLAGQTNSALNFTNVQVTNAGDYDALLIDGFASVTSQVVHLEVDPAFTKITSGNIVNDGGDSAGCAWGDYDNDGNVDLFVANRAGQNNFLYRNQGTGTFEKITVGRIVTDGSNSRGGGAWADYDNDGWLDLS